MLERIILNLTESINHPLNFWKLNFPWFYWFERIIYVSLWISTYLFMEFCYLCLRLYWSRLSTWILSSKQLQIIFNSFVWIRYLLNHLIIWLFLSTILSNNSLFDFNILTFLSQTLIIIIFFKFWIYNSFFIAKLASSSNAILSIGHAFIS